jgi:hypothetical protein
VGYGGAFYAAKSTIVISNSTFSTMEALYGGAFYLDRSVTTIKDSSFSSMTSDDSGGVFY